YLVLFRWQGEKSNANLIFENVEVLDVGGNPQYPVNMSAPMTFKISFKTNEHFDRAGFLETVKISQFDEESWSWLEVTTDGMLTDMTLCVNGAKCPVQVKKAMISTTLDLSVYPSWLSSLKNDAAYQFEFTMTDIISKDFFNFVVQARAFTK
ncbi:hypothetical protein PMAYCL1PPCAC_32251, partial [Pristionchus mayeri]